MAKKISSLCFFFFSLKFSYPLLKRKLSNWNINTGIVGVACDHCSIGSFSEFVQKLGLYNPQTVPQIFKHFLIELRVLKFWVWHGITVRKKLVTYYYMMAGTRKSYNRYSTTIEKNYFFGYGVIASIVQEIYKIFNRQSIHTIKYIPTEIWNIFVFGYTTL